MRADCWFYEVEKQTPCGVWLRLWGMRGDKHGRKFVNLQARKKWAHATPEEAQAAFLIRRRRQVRILSGQLERAQRELEYVKGRKDIPILRY